MKGVFSVHITSLWREQMQWKEDTAAGSRMSTGRSAYGIRTTTYHWPSLVSCHTLWIF